MKSQKSTLKTTALALCLAFVGLASCGNPAGPDQSQWQDVSAFSWPTAISAKLRYRADLYNQDGSLNRSEYHDVRTEVSDVLYGGVPMYTLHDSLVTFRNRVRFLPLADTLITRSETFGADYALVAPLEKNHTWVSSYDKTGTKPEWQATIVERFSELSLEGRVFKNVLVVKYQPAPDQLSTKGVWIRYYAQGVGPIQTIKKLLPQVGADLADLKPIQRTVLVGN